MRSGVESAKGEEGRGSRVIHPTHRYFGQKSIWPTAQTTFLSLSGWIRSRLRAPADLVCPCLPFSFRDPVLLHEWEQGSLSWRLRLAVVQAMGWWGHPGADASGYLGYPYLGYSTDHQAFAYMHIYAYYGLSIGRAPPVWRCRSLPLLSQSLSPRSVVASCRAPWGPRVETDGTGPSFSPSLLPFVAHFLKGQPLPHTL
ncbi:hypothetical protein LZ30DRAFT_217809 [Colletotrichum cereale]|nr:hypothetical protein LZ30DRAFT_217809 [Colletotrichum cereale]